jgi:hypothetical protein
MLTCRKPVSLLLIALTVCQDKIMAEVYWIPCPGDEVINMRMVSALPVGSLVGNYPANPAASVGYVASSSRNDVDMSMRNRLSSGHTIVYAYVESIGPQFTQQAFPYYPDEVPHRVLFLIGEVVKTGNMLPRDHQCMPLRDGIVIRHGNRIVVLKHDTVLPDRTKGAGAQTGRIQRRKK